ncbi:hypothetical protein RHMOL_Rhmol13G0028600 [Rhododendron molle]|uniref:Uncharacterized protein n=1 Tax=Rhododendron molle TaxID=49168 RepID=A0ACC0L3U8_RHOML|nr:hypothetical protein RHMOL_Rhmol13G0028600 [Rhododendron molle]
MTNTMKMELLKSSTVASSVCTRANYRAWIRNVSTREIRELPASDLQDAKAFHYYFGFASSSKEYKLLKLCSAPIDCVCMDDDVPWAMECEILTLGKDASWRRWRTPYAPRVDIRKQSVHIIDGGVLCCGHREGHRLIIFNFQDESFHVINLPAMKGLLQTPGLFFAAIGRSFRPGEGEEELLSCHGALRRSKWVISPPKIRALGETLLTGVETHNKPTVLVYTYDHTKGKFEKFVMGKFPLSLSLSLSPSAASIRKDKDSFCASMCEDTNKFLHFLVSYCEENITPLND